MSALATSRKGGMTGSQARRRQPATLHQRLEDVLGPSIVPSGGGNCSAGVRPSASWPTDASMRVKLLFWKVI